MVHRGCMAFPPLCVEVYSPTLFILGRAGQVSDPPGSCFTAEPSIETVGA